MQAVAIEINGPHNENLQFRPLQRSVRGRFDFNRIGEPMARIKATDWPVIPSQQLGIDPDGVGFLTEPLHDDQYAPIREKIEKQGMTLETRIQTFEGIHLPSWLYWINRAVESGLAVVVSGELPKSIDGQPRKNFVLAEPEPSTTDKLTAAIEKQTATFDRLIEALIQKL